MVMIGDIATFFQGIVTFVRCSRRSSNSPGDLGNMVDSTTGSKLSEMETTFDQDISNLSTDGSNDGGSPDVSDTESTTESTEANSENSSDLIDGHVPVPTEMEGVIAKESCLNKWAQPFVPAEPALVLPHVLPSPTVELPSEANVHANLANVINRLSPEDAATVSAFLKLKLAKSGKSATDPSLQEGPLVVPDCHSQCGFRPPPGLSQPPPIRRESFREPLRPGLVESSVRTRTASDVQDSNLRSNLDKLSQYDPACIFLVRKINRLGLNSPDFLKTYFSTFGTVDCVLASHSIEKPTPGRPKPRVRPAGLAFVVMEKPDDVTSILGFGSEHVVGGVTICASTYEQQKRS